MDLGIWNENWRRNEIWKTACPDISSFPPYLNKKVQVLTFGTNLEWIWLFQIFCYLGVWAKN
jgi:hypothetical protein